MTNDVPPIMKYLQQFMTPAQQQYGFTQSLQQTDDTTSTISSTPIRAMFITNKAEIKNIKPDEHGRLELFVCKEEGKIYSRLKDYTKNNEYEYHSYVDEGEIELFKSETNEAMNKISEALLLVATKLDIMDKKQSELSEVLRLEKTITPTLPVKRKVKKVVYEDEESSDES